MTTPAGVLRVCCWACCRAISFSHISLLHRCSHAPSPLPSFFFYLLICCAASIIVALIPFSFSLDGWPASVSSALALQSFPCFDCFKPNPPVLHTTPSLSSTSPTVDPRHLWYRRGHLTLSTPSNVLPRPPAPSRPAYRLSLSTRLHSLNNFDSSNPQSTRRTHRQTVITD